MAETKEFTDLLEFERSFEWLAPNDLREALKMASIPGVYLPLETFIDIRNNYKAVSKLLSFFAKTKEEQYPNLISMINSDLKLL